MSPSATLDDVTLFPTTLLNSVLSSDYSGTEFKVFCYIYRNTIGYGLPRRAITFEQFRSGEAGVNCGTGLSLPSVRKAIARLRECGVIRTHRGPNHTVEYEIVGSEKILADIQAYYRAQEGVAL